MARTLTMDETGRKLVSNAVSCAEAKTSGEIVTILAERSDSYADVALTWAAGVAFLALTVLASFSSFYLALWERLSGGWIHEWSPGEVLAVAAVVAALKFAGTWLLLLWRPLRLWLVPRAILHGRVRARAISCFKVGAERRTQGRTGVLIYLSLDEHRAEIVADTSIAAKVSPDIWGEAMAAMLIQIRAGRMAEGLAAAVEKVGEVLAAHFPRADDDTNEIPDRLIEV